jgi:hypothetical protein
MRCDNGACRFPDVSLIIEQNPCEAQAYTPSEKQSTFEHAENCSGAAASANQAL